MTTIYVVTWRYSSEPGTASDGIVGARWGEQEARDLANLLAVHSGTRSFDVLAVALEGAHRAHLEDCIADRYIAS